MSDAAPGQSDPGFRVAFSKPRMPELAALSSHERAALHVGLITIAAAQVDSWLTQLIGLIVNGDQPRPELVAGRQLNDKLRMMQALVPSYWEKGSEFVSAIKRVMDERNAVAHAVVEWDAEAFVEMAQGTTPLDLASLPLVFRRENRQGPVPVDEERLRATQLNLELLHSVSIELWSDVIHVNAGNDTRVTPDLPTWVIGWGEDPDYAGWPNDASWVSDVRRLFQIR